MDILTTKPNSSDSSKNTPILSIGLDEFILSLNMSFKKIKRERNLKFVPKSIHQYNEFYCFLRNNVRIQFLIF